MSDDQDERRPLVPPHETWQDYAHQAGMATVNALTVGASGTLLSMIVGPPLSKRRQEFDQEVASRIEELERQGRVDREKLAKDEQFISTYAESTLAAVRTHEKEKREAFRNAVLNSALPSAPDGTLQELFVIWVADFTPAHLAVLKHMQGPPQPVSTGNAISERDTIFAEMLAAIPGLEGRDELATVLVDELKARQLVTGGNLDVRARGGPKEGKRTTRLGDEFLKFILEPETE